MKIAVGLSGGVDSSVTAALLQQAGHDVVGITMKIWRDGRYQGGDKDACFGPGEAEDIRQADELCQKLKIPYHVFDCADEYEKVVLDYFRSEYAAGRTPNPCVRCNSLMKFGVLPNLARKSGLVFDKFATGHYARIIEDDGIYRLLAAVDRTKDQSYFIYRLKQHQLSTLLFPLGEKNKIEVREIARRFGLAVTDKPDSQDFYSGDHNELIELAPRPGDIVDMAGKILGKHQGYWHYTVGQRKGLGIAASHPLYVVGINACANEVVVGPGENNYFDTLTAVDCSWTTGVAPVAGKTYSLKIRSAGQPSEATVTSYENDVLTVKIPAKVFAAAKGQSAVLYDGEFVIGGGIIQNAQ